MDSGDWEDLTVAEDNLSGTAKLVGAVTGLTNNVRYGFQIRAVAANPDAMTVVHSDPSVNVNGTPYTKRQAPREPAIPVAPMVTARSTTSLSVSWMMKPPDRGSPITDYDVQYREAGMTDWSDHPHEGTATTAIITGLEVGAIYQVQVRATNVDGSSAWSLTGTGNTLDDKQEDGKQDDKQDDTDPDPNPGSGGSGGSGSQDAGLRVCPTEASPFTDVGSVMWALAEINCVYGLGITAGTSPDTFGPDDPVTRAQMAVFLARLWEK